MPPVVQKTSSEERLPGLTAAELDDAIRMADPAALLVSPRILRRVIKIDADIGGIGLRVPHRKTYVISRQRLLEIVDRSELDVMPSAELPDTVILIGRPNTEALDELPPETALTKFWRQLFHARVHLAFERLIAAGKLGPNEVANRIAAIGKTEFDEVRLVLRQEEYLLPPKDDVSTYVEFAAVYLELRYFAPSTLPSYFPAIEDPYYVHDVLNRDFNSWETLMATRLPGAPMPNWREDASHNEPLTFVDPVHEVHAGPRQTVAGRRSDRTASALLSRADRARRVGNLMRAAILRTRAAHHAGPEVALQSRESARAELARLARRLQKALKFGHSEAAEWTRALNGLIEQTARGIWTPEARLLYDLQKVCVDHERGIYTLDVIGWAMSLGSKSLKRFLPGQRDVLVTKHLRSASRRVRSVRLSPMARTQLASLLQSAVHRSEGHLRSRFKPLIERALDRVKLLPQNPPERVARGKLVDEVLDRIVKRGYLTMSDLRDALSRNNLKLPDLASARQFVVGDQLLQADRRIAARLDGVYHAGEVYLRWPQRLSSLAFGTPLGRMLTRYVALPFGGAYIALEGLQHLANLVVEYSSDHQTQVHLATLPAVILVGTFLLGLMYNQRFRAICLDALVRIGQVCRRVFVDLPSWLIRLPAIARIIKSWQFRAFVRYLFKPLVVSVFAGMLVALVSDAEVSLFTALGFFLVVNLLLNSPIGRNVDEMVTDWIVQTWHRIRIHVFAALFRFIMDLFNRILATIERFLYTVDEWLRFRAGERRAATVVKAVLGSVWFFVNYFIRFCVTLLVEPQVNPIKHFPVVTVSHKILLPLLFPLKNALEGPLGQAWASLIAGPVIFLLPGVFGFLVWELKENWRLYEANRPPNLNPVPIGQHGETMVQLLRIGFRSGTIPKLFARLRRANRKAIYTDNSKACTKYIDSLRDVSEEVRKFVDRELVEVLHESRSWDDRSTTTGEVRLACNRILIELYFPDLAEDSLWLAFEEEKGWLVASVHRRGWIDTLSAQRRHTFASVLAGFYKMAGATLVREQIESQLEPGSRGYDITNDALVVWSGDNRFQRSYALANWPGASPRHPTDDTPFGSFAEHRRQWVFAATPITWRRWVVTWELDQLDGASKHDVLENVTVLPS